MLTALNRCDARDSINIYPALLIFSRQYFHAVETVASVVFLWAVDAMLSEFISTHLLLSVQIKCTQKCNRDNLDPKKRATETYALKYSHSPVSCYRLVDMVTEYIPVNVSGRICPIQERVQSRGNTYWRQMRAKCGIAESVISLILRLLKWRVWTALQIYTVHETNIVWSQSEGIFKQF